MNKGCLLIDKYYSAIYSPEAFDKSRGELVSDFEEQHVGKYIMKHNASVACEVTDPVGNLFRVSDSLTVNVESCVGFLDR